MIIASEFKAAWWLPQAHMQTIYPTLTRRLTAPVSSVERLELPDGDFIDLAWSTEGLSEDSPLLILLHGLGGSVRSTYAAGLMHAAKNKGWRSVLMHFRGASEEPNRLARAYHSGDTADLNYLLQLLKQREPNSKKGVVGVSLGGNVLLKWLGEQKEQQLIDAAVAVSVPFELRLVADRMHQGISRIYQVYLLRSLRKVFNRKKQVFKDDLPIPLRDVEKWTCFWTFDENVTAPLHGFKHVHDYYRYSSCKQFLAAIATPTLIIHAKDDPFMTPKALPRADELSSFVTLELSKNGGHVGFISGNVPGRPVYWLETRIMDYLVQQIATIKPA